MPPSAIHMDHIRSTIKHAQATAAERHGDTAKVEAKAADKAEARGDAKGEGMSFWDVLDVVNPLQHIPGVNKIYQAITGDTIRTPAKVAGAALFFGPVGMALASADAVLEKETGKDAMGHVASALGLEKDEATPAEDDPFTVTAPRLADAGDAAPAPQEAAPAALPRSAPVELTGGQAALLESLMGGTGQSLPSAPAAAAALAAPPAAAPKAAPAAVTATSITAQAPAAGGIATAQQLKQLETTPGASAALTAARGMGPAAIAASLPAPGAAGSGDNLLTAMSQEKSHGVTTGKGLAEYRAAAISSGSMQVKPIVASRANQMARAAGANMPGANIAAAPRPAQPQPAVNARAAQTVQAPPPAAQIPATPAEQPAAWPPGGATPLPKELIADMMGRAMDKYDARGRTGTGTNATGTVH